MPLKSKDTQFLIAFDFVLGHEGAYSNHSKDPGGATMYGISLRYLRRQKVINGDLDRDGDIDADDIRLITVDIAHEIYLEDWWNRHSYGAMHIEVGKRLFGFSMNMGAASAHRLVQRACRACGYNLKDDGVLGPKTRAAINKCKPWELVVALRSEAAGHYRMIAERNGDLFVFLKGWLNRAYS